MEFFGHIERFAAGLYPYRWLIAVVLAVIAVAAIAVLWRLGVFGWALRHRALTAVAIAAFLVVALPAGYYLASPLWTSTELIEAGPVVADPSSRSTGPGGSAASTTGRVALRGEFKGADQFHFGSGSAQIIQTAPGKYTLRLEDFSVRNGPDLYVYLSPDPNGYAPNAVNLGRLKADKGSFNYEIPDGTDISQVKSVVIWCRQFAVLFATATLSGA